MEKFEPLTPHEDAAWERHRLLLERTKEGMPNGATASRNVEIPTRQPAQATGQVPTCTCEKAQSRSNQKVTPEQATQLITDYEHGLTLLQIGEKHGVSGPTVRRYLIEAGVQMRPPGGWRVPDGSKRYEVVNLAGQGMRQADVARTVGVSRQRVSQILKRWF